MQQTPTQEPMQEPVSAEAQEVVTQPPLEETLTFAPEKKGKMGKTVTASFSKKIRRPR